MRMRGEPCANRRVPEPLSRFVILSQFAIFVMDRSTAAPPSLAIPQLYTFDFECSPQIQAPSGLFFGGK